MALVKKKLKTNIEQLLSDMRKREKVSDSYFAEQLAAMIDEYIKSATVTVAAGIPVATTGSPAAQTGATTAPGKATIS